ncbi:MAG: hydrogenase maturation peptidase HycI [Petrotogales bacterium]
MNYLVMCVGNRRGGDDAIGPYIADKLKSSEDFAVIDCGTTPENYTSVVKQCKPKQVVIIDAVEMDLNPGEIRIVPKEKIGNMHVSTHNIPISILIQYLERHVENILFIGIQPKTMSGQISMPVKKSGEKLIKLIEKNKLKQIETLH